ncbi:MAG: DUF3857 domain-containing protein [Terracidiphilus sp.]
MTSDPKAPGADAVYLYREETTDFPQQLRSYYSRIKVLTEKGKELATVQIPFERGYTKVEKVEARTIHSDGTVIPLAVKPEDLVDFKSKYYQKDTLVFTLPSVEVGSIVEYRLQIKFSHGVPAPRWLLQCPYFVRKEHFDFQPGSLEGTYVNEYGRILDRLMAAPMPFNAPIAIQTVGHDFTIDLIDVPPIPDEDWMPPINTIRWRVQFYFTYARNARDFWDSESKIWNLGNENFLHISNTIKKAAAGLVNSEDTDEQKARKIYAAVMKLDNTDWSRVKSQAERKKEKLKEIHSVDDIWKNQSGPGNAIALIYVALARAAGLKAWPAQIVDRNLALFDYDYLDFDQLDDYIAIVNIGGKDIFVDPAQKVAPFGSLHWAHTLATGFRESDSGPAEIETPEFDYKDNTVARTADLTVDAASNARGTARIVLSGAPALYWRQQALQNDVGELKKEFKEYLVNDLPDGIDVDFDHFAQLEDDESNLTAIVNLSGMIGTATGKRLILPGLFFETRAKHPFVSQDKRTTPVDVHFPEMESDDVVYHLPPGYTVESAPRTPEVNWTGIAQMRINSAVKEDSVEVTRVFARTFTLLKPEDYGDLHNFYLRLALADQQQILLSRPVAAKGN